MLIPRRLLVACGPFGPGLPASTVTAAIARGLLAGGAPAPDVCLLPTPGDPDRDSDPELQRDRERKREREREAGDVHALLDTLDFDARMRAARAVVLGARRLQERTLAGSITFEIATRARQGGVPAYAVTGENQLEPFDARILDLQVVLQADSHRALAAAGRTLAAIS